MKIFYTQDIKERTISNIIVVASGIAITAFIFLFKDVMNFVHQLFKTLSPFLIAFATAFIVASPMKRIEMLFQKLLCRKKPREKLCRMLAILVCYILLFALLTAFTGLVVPQLLASVRGLSLSVTSYFRTHQQDIIDLLEKYNITGENPANVLITWESITAGMLDFAGKALLSLASMSASISNVLLQSFLGLIVSVYMLYDKEHFVAQSKKVAYAFMPIDKVNNVIFWMRKSHGIFSSFVAGKIIETVVVGVLCYIGMVLFRMDYAMLISVIVGITNIIPIIGAFAGAIIGALILLISDPLKALWFLIFVTILQQIDGNILAPRILGNSTGLTPFWTVLAIVLGGGWFGLGGMILCVPVFALMYAIFRTIVEARLQEKNMPILTDAYEKEGAVFLDDGVSRDGSVHAEATVSLLPVVAPHPSQTAPDKPSVTATHLHATPTSHKYPATHRPNKRKRK